MKKFILFIVSILFVNLIVVSKDFISSCVFGLVMFYFLNKITNEKTIFKKSNLILSILFSLFLIVGSVYHYHGSMIYLFNNVDNSISTILKLFIYPYVFYLIISRLFIFIDNLKFNHTNNKILNEIFYKHPFRYAFLITLGVSLVYLIFFYPGTISFDGLWQLNFYYGYRSFSDHHPALLTYFMGFLMDVGRIFGSDNLGIFFYVILQVLINSLVYAYVLKIMDKIKSPLVIRIFALIFYAFFPLLVINSITYIKDTIFYLVFLFIFVYTYYHFKLNYKSNYYKKYIVLFVFYVLLFLLRNTGLYIVIISLIAFIIYYFKKSRKDSMIFLIILVSILGINFTYKNVFLKAMNINKAPIREALSVPLQCTARYLREFPDDLTLKEKEALESIFEDYTNLGYTPERSDPVKWNFSKSPSGEELKNYFISWFKMGIRHPFVYIEAFIHNYYGYFYPGVLNFMNEGVGYYTINDAKRINDGYFDVYFNSKFDKIREKMFIDANKLTEVPVIGMFYIPAFYTWILILVSAYLILRGKKDVLIYLIPLYVVLLICFVSPVNSHIRYLQPLVVAIPFILAILYYEKSKVNN